MPVTLGPVSERCRSTDESNQVGLCFLMTVQHKKAKARVGALLMALLLSTSLLTGCGSQKSGTAKTPKTKQSQTPSSSKKAEERKSDSSSMQEDSSKKKTSSKKNGSTKKNSSAKKNSSSQQSSANEKEDANQAANSGTPSSSKGN